MNLPFAKQGVPLFLLSFLLFLLFLARGRILACLFFLMLFLFFLFFFRSPKREPLEQESHILVSPADGRIKRIEDKKEEDIVGKEMKIVTIFMSLFDVHVNRSPCDGKVAKIVRKKGGFCLAFKERSEGNARNVILIERAGDPVVVKQIAGFIARRIFCYRKVGETVRRGEALGMIAFGSRVDLCVPMGYDVLVREGDKVKAGITPIATGGDHEEEER